MKIGDIVEGLPGAPYHMTCEYTRWFVVGRDADLLYLVDTSDNNYKNVVRVREKLKEEYNVDAWDSLRDTIPPFRVQHKFFKIVKPYDAPKYETNRDAVSLLHKDKEEDYGIRRTAQVYDYMPF